MRGTGNKGAGMCGICGISVSNKKVDLKKGLRNEFKCVRLSSRPTESIRAKPSKMGHSNSKEKVD